MRYGDEFCVHLPPGFDPETASAGQLDELFQDAERITHFHDSRDGSFVHLDTDLIEGYETNAAKGEP